MKKGTKLMGLSAALILLGIFLTTVSLGGQVSAQEQKIDLEKLKQIMNETRTAMEANDDPGALTLLDLADQMLSGGNMTAGTNTTNNTAIVTG